MSQQAESKFERLKLPGDRAGAFGIDQQTFVLSQYLLRNSEPLQEISMSIKRHKFKQFAGEP